MNAFININIGRHLDYLPHTLQGKSDLHQLRQFVRSLTSDGQRLILLDIEREIKTVAGEKKRWFFRKFSEEELEHLSFLLELRSFVLDEMALHPSDEEVKRLERVNEKLLRLTEEMNERTCQLRQRLEKISLLENWKKPHIHVDGSLRFHYDDEQPALIFPNDGYYGSDFDYMLGLLCEVTEDWKYPHEFIEDTDKPLDDGMTWADGYLLADAYQHICVCYALHALCCHLPYSIPDVLRMNNITLTAKVCYEHDFYDPDKEKREYYGLK